MTAGAPGRGAVAAPLTWLRAAGQASLLETGEDVTTDNSMNPLAASPKDIENGDYEIQCRTDCDFVPSGDADFATGGKAALFAANDLALTQAALKKVTDQLNADPENEELQLQREKLQVELTSKTHALQVAAGASVPDMSGELEAASLEVVKARLQKVIADLEEHPGDEKLLTEKNKLSRVIAAKEDALREAAAQEQDDMAVKAEVDNLSEKMRQLKEELASNPESEELQKEISDMEGKLEAKSAQADAVAPRKECYKVCTNPHTASRQLLARGEDVDGCVRMCVKVMRQLVYRMGQSFL